VATSLDEAYLDLTDYLATTEEGADEAVHQIRAKIEATTSLTASAGVAPNARLAKVCSDVNKPNGQFRLMPQEAKVEEFVRNLPIRKIGGVGNVSAQLLAGVGIANCGDLWIKRGVLKLLFSEISFQSFLSISLGLGHTTLEGWNERERKSMGSETTFRDTSNFEELCDVCSELCAEVAKDLSERGMKCRALTLKIKTHRFQLKTKVSQLHAYTDECAVIESAAKTLLRHFCETAEEKPLKLRLMGVSASSFEGQMETNSKQKTLESCFANKAREEPASSSFECPSCGESVTARSEGAFNAHLDACLRGKEEEEEEVEKAVKCPVCQRRLPLKSGQSADHVVSAHLDEGKCWQEEEEMREKPLIVDRRGAGKKRRAENAGHATMDIKRFFVKST